jgi:hypothetical protein
VSWQTEMTPLLRALVDDMDETRYTDERLEQVLAVAAFQVEQDADFVNDYTVGIATPSIDPDPTDADTLDPSFTNLVTIRAACVLDRGSATSWASKGVLVRSGAETLDTRDSAKNKVALLKTGWCAVYAEQLLAYEADQNKVAGAMVLTPFRAYAISASIDR